MTWTTFISTAIQLVILLVSKWFEQDAAKKKLKEECLKDIKNGIAERDASKITAAFARAGRISR